MLVWNERRSPGIDTPFTSRPSPPESLQVGVDFITQEEQGQRGSNRLAVLHLLVQLPFGGPSFSFLHVVIAVGPHTKCSVPHDSYGSISMTTVDWTRSGHLV